MDDGSTAQIAVHVDPAGGRARIGVRVDNIDAGALTFRDPDVVITCSPGRHILALTADEETIELNLELAVGTAAVVYAHKWDGSPTARRIAMTDWYVSEMPTVAASELRLPDPPPLDVIVNPFYFGSYVVMGLAMLAVAVWGFADGRPTSSTLLAVVTCLLAFAHAGVSHRMRTHPRSAKPRMVDLRSGLEGDAVDGQIAGR